MCICLTICKKVCKCSRVHSYITAITTLKAAQVHWALGAQQDIINNVHNRSHLKSISVYEVYQSIILMSHSVDAAVISLLSGISRIFNYSNNFEFICSFYSIVHSLISMYIRTFISISLIEKFIYIFFIFIFIIKIHLYGYVYEGV